MQIILPIPLVEDISLQLVTGVLFVIKWSNRLTVSFCFFVIFKIYDFNLCNSLFLPTTQLNKNLQSVISANKMQTKRNPLMWLSVTGRPIFNRTTRWSTSPTCFFQYWIFLEQEGLDGLYQRHHLWYDCIKGTMYSFGDAIGFLRGELPHSK